jgi:hypothetical protein
MGTDCEDLMKMEKSLDTPPAVGYSLCMLLIHVTHRDRAEAILREGLRPELAESETKRSWLAKAGRLDWAIVHCARRHCWELRELAVMTFRVPRRHVARAGQSGLWYATTLTPGCACMMVGKAIDLGALPKSL